MKLLLVSTAQQSLAAIATYQKSLELNPEFSFALYGLATAYIKQGRNQEAVPPLPKRLEVEPKHGFGNHALGLVYARTGNNRCMLPGSYPPHSERDNLC